MATSIFINIYPSAIWINLSIYIHIQRKIHVGKSVCVCLCLCARWKYLLLLMYSAAHIRKWKELGLSDSVSPAAGTYHTIHRKISSGWQEVLEKKHWEIDFRLQELWRFPEPEGQELTPSSIKLENKLTQNFSFENFAVRWERGTKQNSFYSFRSGFTCASLARSPSGSAWGIGTGREVWSQKAWFLEI